MSASVTHRVRMSRAVGAGTPTESTVGAVLAAAARRAAARGDAADAARLRADLVGPPLPPALLHVWGWWLELHAARGSGLAGPAPLTHAAVRAWADTTGRAALGRPTPGEVRALFWVEVAWREAVAEGPGAASPPARA